MHLHRGEEELARKEIERGLNDIHSYENHDSPVFTVEKIRSIQNLEQLLNQVSSEEYSEKHILEEELEKAVENENYEQAAQIRDRLKDIDS